MMAGDRDHWDGVYEARAEDALTWFESTPALSLELIERHLRPGDPIVDVGGGASRMVDALLDAGFGPLSVLDLSGAALATSRQRLGTRADRVRWIEADVTRWRPDTCYALWHDRAVFHFLTQAADRAAYARSMAEALRPGGIAIVATFAEDGPETCSGLPVMRYAPQELAGEFERLLPGRFAPVEARRHAHVTPKGHRQSFQYTVFRRAPDPHDTAGPVTVGEQAGS